MLDSARSESNRVMIANGRGVREQSGVKRIVDACWFCALALLASAGCATHETSVHVPDIAETKAVRFLMREVPSWSRQNNCYSCHNNGDGARALYAAMKKGHEVSENALADTTAWLANPPGWDKNKGDPGFSDKRLANIQFAAALLAALEAGELKDRSVLKQAARKVAADQGEDGAWWIDPKNTVGSPATYGTTLATYMAWRILRDARAEAPARKKAERWLGGVRPNNISEIATWLLASSEVRALRSKQDLWLATIQAAQTHDGGWGPYADASPEVFDTALVLLALAEIRDKSATPEMIKRGRKFLIAEQNSDGSWAATTRPRGSHSYAQLISTTAWAAMALMATEPPTSSGASASLSDR
jgi:hypothetical protein